MEWLNILFRNWMLHQTVDKCIDYFVSLRSAFARPRYHRILKTYSLKWPPTTPLCCYPAMTTNNPPLLLPCPSQKIPITCLGFLLSRKQYEGRIYFTIWVCLFDQIAEEILVRKHTTFTCNYSTLISCFYFVMLSITFWSFSLFFQDIDIKQKQPKGQNLL